MLNTFIENQKLTWHDDIEFVRKLYSQIEQSETYQNYMSDTDDSTMLIVKYGVNCISNSFRTMMIWQLCWKRRVFIGMMIKRSWILSLKDNQKIRPEE